MPNVEIYAAYEGAPDNDKALQAFATLKAHAAKDYPTYGIGGSRFETTHNGGVERHTHFLTLIDPTPPPAPEIPPAPLDGTKV